ncbi:uncharacterized protein TNCV_598671 [Trichonephila clavipes]|nr:uncharacterized protein TNCV_598671 [Trichonephila clavipes]
MVTLAVNVIAFHIEQRFLELKRTYDRENVINSSETNEICVSGDGTWKTRGHTSRIGVCSIIGDITGKVIDVEVLSSYCKGCDRWKKIIDVSVSYDGTWQKRGHTSNIGLGIIIDILSGLVLDFEVLSKYCHNCVVAGRDMGVDSAEFHIWQKGHADECDKNFDGTSGAMEMHAALIMWRRSISDCQMRFVSMLSDGDSKLFNFLSDNKIYGSDIKIEKEECLNHIAKRLGIVT